MLTIRFSTFYMVHDFTDQLFYVNFNFTQMQSLLDERFGVFLAYKVEKCLLSEILRKRDMTQTELADLMGVKLPQINKYVLDKQKMSLEVAKNISFILNCQIDDLYEWKWTNTGDNE